MSGVMIGVDPHKASATRMGPSPHAQRWLAATSGRAFHRPLTFHRRAESPARCAPGWSD